MTKQSDRLKAKRVYAAPSDSDGARILVDRIWPRGITKERAALALWLKEIAPTNALRKWFGHDPARWGEFCRRYVGELDMNDREVGHLRDIIKKGRVTLLYGALDEAHNNAVVLTDYLLKEDDD